MLAQISVFTQYLLRCFSKKVIAIEPEIKNYNMLLSNLDVNQISNEKVEALPLAISTQHADSFTKIYLTEDVAGASCHQVGRNQDHLLREQSNVDRKSRSVYCISLASIVEQASANHDGPIHIKIDVDGIEDDVCQSLFDTRLINRISSLQIELNPKIAQHERLIKKLNNAGFAFCESQVESSRRKSGNFEGFAEIVFRRSIDTDSIGALPSEYVLTLGKNYVPITVQRQKISVQKLFTSSSSAVTRLSRLPSTFVLKNAFDSENCSKIFHQLASEILSDESSLFEFKNSSHGSSNNSKRLRIKNSLIRQFCPEYLDNLRAEMCSNETISRINCMSRIASESVFTQAIYLAITQVF